MAASRRSEFSVDVKGKRSTKGAGKEKRVPNLDNDLIIAIRVAKGLNRWKFLQTKILEKQRKEKVEKSYRSKRLEPYTKERDGLVEQMQKDIPELESIFFDEYSNAFDRKDIRRTTTGGMRNEIREPSGLQSAESEIRNLKSQLENERTSKEEALSRLKRRLDESENEKVAPELNHEKEIGEKIKEIAKLQERLTIDNSYEERAKKLKTKCDELETELASLEDEKRRTDEELKRLGVKNNELTDQLENERKANKDVLVRLRSAESEIIQLKRQLENETKPNEQALVSLNRRLDESENEKVALELNHKKEMGERIKEIAKLQERIEDENRRTVEELKRLGVKNNELTNQLENEKKTNEQAFVRLRSAESEIIQLKRQLENERKPKEETLWLEAKNNQLTTQLENERKAKEDALLRLSSMASNRLRDNNPNIADLSDPNRPTKLSEQFSELYDNEWTDAFDELEKMLQDKKEKEIISYLRDFVLEIHSVCSDLSFSKMKTIEEAFVKPSVPSENTKIPSEISKTIKDGIKSMAPKLLENTKELVLGCLEEKYLNDPVSGCLQHKNVKRYIDKCTEVCWYMSVQDPQLVMDGSKSPDDKFDSNKHREYTKKGPYEEFVVWPVLYLYKGGQMLSKGVAQGGKQMTGQQ